jgi:hypothetical protein
MVSLMTTSPQRILEGGPIAYLKQGKHLLTTLGNEFRSDKGWRGEELGWVVCHARLKRRVNGIGQGMEMGWG